MPQTEQDQKLRMSYEEYLAWAGEDVHAEWVNGEVIVQRPPQQSHQRAVAFLLQLMGLFIQLFQLGQLLPAPFEMRAMPAAGVREYWILDPRPGYERADFYVLDEQGRYRPVPVD
jgi:Uma2 family endonuclease